MIYKANVDFIWPIFVLIEIYMSGIRYNHNRCWYSLIIKIHVEKIHKCFLACALHIVRPSNEGATKMKTFSSIYHFGWYLYSSNTLILGPYLPWNSFIELSFGFMMTFIDGQVILKVMAKIKGTLGRLSISILTIIDKLDLEFQVFYSIYVS